MIAPLRRRHRLLVSCLAVLTPLGLLVALGSRTPDPVQETLPELLTVPGRPAGLRLLPTDAPLELDGRPLVFHGSADELWVELLPGTGPAWADALLLWSPDQPGGDAPIAGATFLGSLGNGPRSFRLPGTPDAGWLVLYSLAHSELIASVALPAGLLP